jgi:esterase/lipase superfamily enzyme
MSERYLFPREAFTAMTRRRLERFVYGRVQPVSGRSMLLRNIVLLIIALFTLTQIALHIEGLLSFWLASALLIFISVFMAIVTIVDCVMSREIVLTKLGLCVFSLSAIWYIAEFKKDTSQPIYIISTEKWNIIKSCIFCEMTLFVLYLITFQLVPRLSNLFSKYPELDKYWFRIKTVDSSTGTYSYRPFGYFAKRKIFTYTGEVNEENQPHGIGTWKENSFNGECLTGRWDRGVPVGPFISRESGTDAVFKSELVLFATSRKEPSDETTFIPKRDKKGLRYGLCSVESCCGGVYYDFFPRVLNVTDTETVNDAINVLQTKSSYQGVSSREPPSVQIRDLSGHFAGEIHTARFVYDRNTGNIVLDSRDVVETSSEASSLERGHLHGHEEFIVFFHGFNCSLADAMRKFGLLMALGKFPDHIIPIIFSQSSGGFLSYFKAKDKLCIFVEDAVDLIKQLQKRSGSVKIHLLGHSMGCDLLLKMLKEISDETISKFESVVLLNADVDMEIFNDVYRPALNKISNLTTIYVDRQDRALILSSVVSCFKPKLGLNINTSDNIDIIDTTDILQNVHSMRHSYFNLNIQIIYDIQQIIKHKISAKHRTQSLSCINDSTYIFLCPPPFINADKAKA